MVEDLNSFYLKPKEILLDNQVNNLYMDCQ